MDRCQDVLIRPERYTSIEQTEAHGGAVGQRNVGRLCLQVVRGGSQYSGFLLLLVGEPVLDRIVIQSPTMPFDPSNVGKRPKVEAPSASFSGARVKRDAGGNVVRNRNGAVVLEAGSLDTAAEAKKTDVSSGFSIGGKPGPSAFDLDWWHRK